MDCRRSIECTSNNHNRLRWKGANRWPPAKQIGFVLAAGSVSSCNTATRRPIDAAGNHAGHLFAAQRMPGRLQAEQDDTGCLPGESRLLIRLQRGRMLGIRCRWTRLAMGAVAQGLIVEGSIAGRAPGVGNCRMNVLSTLRVTGGQCVTGGLRG